MSRGFGGAVQYKDTRDIDAFGRLRVGAPQGLFDTQLTYDLAPLVFEALAANGGGGTATVAHDTTNRAALMTFTSALTGATAYMQSYEFVRYQPGRSQAVFVTFNFIEAVANIKKFAGISDGSNGVELQQDGTTVQVVLLSNTDNGDQTVAQASWNIDPMDGTGPSGVTLDLTKTQIVAMDFQALYVGRVRVGFDIDGVLYYVHEFLHANSATTPYIQYASLPVRCGMTASGTVSSTMRFICSAVVSEGGQEENGGIPFCENASITAGSGTATHLMSLRPKTTFNSLENRSKVILDSVDVVVTGNNPVLWSLVVGQVLTTPTYADVNATYSAMEALAGAGTLSGTPAIIIQQGYVAASNQQKGGINAKISSRIPLTLDAAGAVRANGTLTLLVEGVGGTSATQAVINWRELR